MQGSTSGQPVSAYGLDGKAARRRHPPVPLANDQHRQNTFHKRKNGLMKKAMELSVLCDCDLALIVFSSDGKLTQYSSTDMEGILERYSKACHEPHERRNNQQLWKAYFNERAPGAGDLANGSNKRMRLNSGMPTSRRAPGSPAHSDASVSSLSEGSMLAPTGDVLKPLGLTIDKHQFPVSPRSEGAYDRINTEFDKLMEQLYALHDAPKDVENGPSASTSAAADTAATGRHPSSSRGPATTSQPAIKVEPKDTPSTSSLPPHHLPHSPHASISLKPIPSTAPTLHPTSAPPPASRPPLAGTHPTSLRPITSQPPGMSRPLPTAPASTAPAASGSTAAVAAAAAAAAFGQLQSHAHPAVAAAAAALASAAAAPGGTSLMKAAAAAAAMVAAHARGGGAPGSGPAASAASLQQAMAHLQALVNAPPGPSASKPPLAPPALPAALRPPTPTSQPSAIPTPSNPTPYALPTTSRPLPPTNASTSAPPAGPAPPRAPSPSTIFPLPHIAPTAADPLQQPALASAHRPLTAPPPSTAASPQPPQPYHPPAPLPTAAPAPSPAPAPHSTAAPHAPPSRPPTAEPSLLPFMHSTLHTAQRADPPPASDKAAATLPAASQLAPAVDASRSAS